MDSKLYGVFSDIVLVVYNGNEHKSMSLKVFIILIFAVAFSLFFNLFQKNISPPGFNADEAAFGYNAYSIFKTGKDEYGTFFPLRLKSFGDYKMPVYSYLDAPIVGIFGLTEFNTRALNTIVALFFPIVAFFLSKQLFKKDTPALFSAILVGYSLALHIVGRHAHEAYPAAFLIALTTLFFIRSVEVKAAKDKVFFFILLFVSLFTYQSSRIFAFYFFMAALVFFFIKKLNKKFLAIFIVLLVVFAITDIKYSPDRVKNLLLFNSLGFGLQVNELKAEGGNKFLYNKLTVGLEEIVQKHLLYFSPQFLAINGDDNPRFGFKGMSPMSPIAYAFIFIGIFYLFYKKEKWRYILVSLLFITPLSASLSWGDLSLTRSLFLFVIALVLSGYGMVEFFYSLRSVRFYQVIIAVVIIIELFFSYFSWDFYLYHYPQRKLVIRDWQAGYKEFVSYLKTNYNHFNTFYITKKHGEPYIFLLFYMQYPPEKYQKQAKLTPPDEFGFGQVEKFDKFNFNFQINSAQKNVALIGYPDDYLNTGVNPLKIKKIAVGEEEIFWIYEK